MGTCVICGTSVDGRVCQSHQEDVAFEFRGVRPDQLVRGRYYRGAVDGFADFGVFVDIGERVTGLLHRSEIDGRLESLDWESGDEVYVQVLDLHDNGNVDLGWSIRQSAAEFRDRLVHDPDADGETEFRPEDDEPASEEPSGPVGRRDPGASEGNADGSDGGADVDVAGDAAADSAGTADQPTAETSASGDDAAGATGGDGGDTAADDAADDAAAASDGPRQPDTASREAAPAEHVAADALADRVGDTVRLEGEITSVRQTGGPTIFELTDETGTVDCAAFVAAGERAYPEIETGTVVALEGTVERHRGELQVETDGIEALDGEKREDVASRLDSALDERAAAPGEELLAEDPALAEHREALEATATALRRAVIDGQPVVLRHAASVDGYAAGAALERALLDLVREVHDAADAEYHYLERRPLRDDVYDMSAATDDVTDFLDAAERHDEPRPLVAFVAAGDTETSLEGNALLEAYDVDRLVVAGGAVDGGVADAIETTVGVEGRSATTLAANVGALAAPETVDELAHLPAVSYWADAPATYSELAAEHGADADAVRELREALALQAYYQSYEDKRELVRDLLFGDQAGLAGEVSRQFRDRLEDELRTATPHVKRHEVGDVAVRVLDVEAFTHQYEFPPTAVLLDALHRRAEDDAVATVGVGGDDLRLRAGSDLDVRAVAAALEERLPEAGVRLRNGRRGRVEFLRGQRGPVVDAVVDVVGEQLAGDADRAGDDADAERAAPDATDGGAAPDDH